MEQKVRNGKNRTNSMEQKPWNRENQRDGMRSKEWKAGKVRGGRYKIKGREGVEPKLGNRRYGTEGMEWMTTCSILQRKLTTRYNVPYT